MPVVIIPAYRPDETLITLADRLWTYGYRILVVDDGSGWEYEEIFDRVEDICIVLRHSKNRGKGAAIKTALSYIEKEIWDSGPIGIMDCDGQHLAEDMQRLLKTARKHGGALVLGIREIGVKMPLRSRMGNQITRTVFRLVTGGEISDTQTGLRAFTPELIPGLLTVEGERYEYEMNVLMSCVKEGIPIKEVPIHTIYRDENNSTSHFRSIRDSARIYKDILKFTLSSLSSFVLDYLLFSLCMLLMPHTPALILFANIAARSVSAFYNYSVNCRFVFHTDQKIKTGIHYFALAGVILIMNNVVLQMLVQALRMPVYPAKLMTECLLFMLSWLIQNCVIFRREKCLARYALADGKAKL